MLLPQRNFICISDQDAARCLIMSRIAQLRHRQAAFGQSHRTTRFERTSRRKLGELRHNSGNWRKPSAFQRWRCRNQSLRVRVTRRTKHIANAPLFHDAAGLHYRHAVGHSRHHAQVVSDK